MDIMAGDHLLMTFYNHDLPLFFLGSGRREIEEFIVVAASEAIAHTFTACESRKLFACGVWSVFASSSTCVSYIEWMYVFVAWGFTSTSLYPPFKVPFCTLFHFTSGSGYLSGFVC
jgi:hypothetical protein